MAAVTEVGGIKLGKLLIEGKTKQVFDVPSLPGHSILLNKDRITAHNGVRSHDLEGKAQISNQTNAKVFGLLNQAGLETAFVRMVSDNAFLARKCDMVPIEWVTRRLATGSYLKRNPGVKEGFRFSPPKQETFFKDDANDDPQWSEEQIVSTGFKVNGVLIGQDEVDIMRQTSILVFEVLERAWATRNCALIDMKIEFGVDADGQLLVADVIDSDSWRLWPSGDKRLMVDKQVYRNLASVTASDLDTVKRNFMWVSEQLDNIQPKNDHLVVVLMGSPSDKDHCEKIAKHCRELGLNVELRVTSAHKGTKTTLHIVAFAFKQQCDIAYRTLRSLAEQYNLAVASSENTKETQTDKAHYWRQYSPSSIADPIAIAKGPEQKYKEPELLAEEYLHEVTDSSPDKSKLNSTTEDLACKVEAFENVEYLVETLEEDVKKIKNEPITEDNNSNSDVDFDCEQVDFLELEYEEEAEDSLSPIKEESPKKSAKVSPGNHTCEYCSKVFRRGTHLRRHILIHTQEKPFKCKICAKAFARSDHLTIHETTFHSKERPFACKLCDKSFKRAEHLRNHIDSKHNETVSAKKPEVCEICKKGFTSAKNLELHKKTHSQPKVHKCTFCEEQFADKNDHRLHVRQLHLEGKAFLCSECGQSFLRNDYLMVHMRRHKGIKPYKCKFCPKAFPRATDLRVHEKYHTNEKPHLCTICGKSFHRAYNLVVHSRTHNGLKPYQCPHCPKSFAQGNDLKAHVRRHTGERYRCELCNEGFIQCYQLTNHKRTVHNIDTATSTRRVTKFLTPSAQEQQMLLQEQHQQLERLLEQQKALEQQQQQTGWDIQRADHDPNLEKKISETKEQIHLVERELEEINLRLHEELERCKLQQPQTGDSHLEVDLGELNRSANSSYGQDFLNDTTNALQSTGSVKNENFTQ